ncbi:MAG: cytochrome c [Gemmatimonadota bacterium]
MFDFFGVVMLLALLSLFVWLTRRSWRASRKWLKWTATPLSALATLIFFLALGAALFGFYLLNRNYDNPPSAVAVQPTSEEMAFAEKYLLLCAGCHSPDEELPLVGNDFLAEDEAPPIGTFYAPNLTPVHLGDWSDGEIIRAIREGVHRSGRSLLIMPSETFGKLSDAHVRALVTVLRRQQSEGKDTPPARLNVLGALMSIPAPIFAVQPAIASPVEAPARGPTAAYGAYLASITCALCHGADLRGNEEFEVPGLTLAGETWRAEQFVEFIRTGVKPNGVVSDTEVMPWETLSAVFSDDEDLLAIFAHMSEIAGAE